MATINPSQDYDVIHTLTYASSGGTDYIELYRGSPTPHSGTVYYRAGTSGAWTSLSVSGTSTTFPITSTTMQIAHNWNKYGNDYMAPSFDGGIMTGIEISQKAALSGTVGSYFMVYYTYDCPNLTSLAAPDTSGLTVVGDYFMLSYAYDCSSLTTLEVPDTSGLTSAGSDFMNYYAYGCSALTTLGAPDVSGLTSAGDSFMSSYADGCSGLTSLSVPDTSGLTSADSYFMDSYAESCSSLTTLAAPDISGLTNVGHFFMSDYANNCSSLATLAVPDTSGLTSAGTFFMDSYAWGCNSLTQLTLPKAGRFKTTNVSWDVPGGRLGVLKGFVLDSADLADWKALTVSGKTLHTNYIRNVNDVYTNTSPTTTLDTPAASGTVSGVRPTLDFTGVDTDNDTITYQLQLNPTNSFTTPTLDVLSASNVGFTNRSDVKTDPFYSGNQIRYTLQTDLARGSDYYWRVRGRDTNGSNSWGEWTTARKFTVSAIPATVTITGLADILDTSLKVNGTIADNGGATVTERGAVLSTSPNPTTSDLKFTATGDTFTAEATGLTGATTYYVRTYAINAAGTSYSSQSTIMTLQPIEPPTLTVGDPVRLLDVSAQLTATVTLDGTSEVTERGIVFSTSPNPDTSDNIVTANTIGLGEYTLLLTGLLPETTYYYRAYAINDQGTGYSTEKSFTTSPPFVPDEGDGYWVFSVTGSDAIVSRSQATPANSSVSLPLADLGLEDGKTYTLAVGDFVSELGDLGVSLLYYDAANPVTTNVPENSQLTFTYNLTDYHTYILQLHVTGDDPVVEELTATFKDLYLAEESTFSDFVPFTPYGLFEIKLENNQIVDKRRQDVIQSMYNRLEGWEITPFEVTTEGLGYFEIGDGITIKDPQDNEVKSYITEYTLTLDGGITEKLIGKRPAESKTDYSKAGNIKKLISNTTLQVDKQRQEIEALVQDVTGEGGYIDEKFTQVFQDISQVRTTVQGAGGVNLIRNSVMYAYNNLGYPEEWTTTHVDGEGSTIVIQGSAESKAAGGLSGHIFTLNGTKVVQTVTVRKDADFITEENKTFYTFNIKVKKDLVGVAYIKLSNRQEEHIIDLPNGEEYLWEDFSIEGLLPQDDHYEIEIYSDSDANAQFTDAMLSVGEYTHSWTQAPGEAMNMVRSDTVDGTFWRSPQFRYNYTHISPLGMNVHQRIRGQEEEVFGFNADETNMSKVKATKQMSMGKIRVVPIEMNGTSGWAWTGAEE